MHSAYTGLDVIGEVTFSKRFGFMDAQKDDGTFQQIRDALRSGSWIGQVPLLFWIHDYLMPIVGNYLGINVRHGRMRDFTVQEIQNRKSRGSDRPDILGKLFEVQKEKPSEMSDTNVISMAASNIFAGSDTTAISLRAILYYLLKNPEYKRRLLEEIDLTQKNNGMSDRVTMDQASQMKYLQAVMYEALRCHPAVGMNLPRVTPPGGIEIDGLFIPEGVCDYTVSKLYGQNTDRDRLSWEQIHGLYTRTRRFMAQMLHPFDPTGG